MSTLDTDVLLTRSPQAEADSQFIRRWSPRAMSGEAVTLGEIEQLVEAARWAPPVLTLNLGGLFTRCGIRPNGSQCLTSLWI